MAGKIWKMMFLMLLVAFAVLAIFRCGGSDSPSPGDGGGDASLADVGSDGGISVTKVIGAAGGTVEASDGLKVTFPPGALDNDVTIYISSIGLAVQKVSTAYRFEPAGQAFKQSVTVSMPFSSAKNDNLVLFWSRVGDDTAFDEIAGTVQGAAYVSGISHFSIGYIGVSGVEPADAGGDSGYDGGKDAGTADAATDAGGDGGIPDAGIDSGFDGGGTDTGFDAGVDAGFDAGADAGADGGLELCADLGGKLGWMCAVPAGVFHMGCNSAVDVNCNGETPYHDVTVPNFAIDKYEVTVAAYKACVDASACTVPDTNGNCTYYGAGRENNPVNCVNWTQASAFCQWAGKRLPSEAEWEKAARGTDGRKYPWGNTPEVSCDYAVIYSGGAGCGTGWPMDVGNKAAGVSPYGCMDMVGNESEWVEDDWHDSYTSAPTNGSAWIDAPRSGDRVLKSGSFGHSLVSYLRPSMRYYNAFGNQGQAFGFRCAVGSIMPDGGFPDGGK